MAMALPGQEQGTLSTGREGQEGHGCRHVLLPTVSRPCWQPGPGPRMQEAKLCLTPEPSDCSSASKCGWAQWARPAASSSLAWPQLAALGSLGAAREGRAGGWDGPGTGHRTREDARTPACAAVEGPSPAAMEITCGSSEESRSVHTPLAGAAAAGRAQPEGRNFWAGGTISSSSPAPTEGRACHGSALQPCRLTEPWGRGCVTAPEAATGRAEPRSQPGAQQAGEARAGPVLGSPPSSTLGSCQAQGDVLPAIDSMTSDKNNSRNS